MAPLVQRYVPRKQFNPAASAPLSSTAPATEPSKSTPPNPDRAKKQKRDKSAAAAIPVNGNTQDPRFAPAISNGAVGHAEIQPRSNDKSKRKRESSSLSSSNGPSIHPDRAAMVDEDVVKRRKVESTKPSIDDGDQADGALDAEAQRVLKKHGGILSKFQKSISRAREQPVEVPAEVETRELHDLVPLPQPEREATPEYQQTFSTLPAWVANSTLVHASTRAPFGDLGVDGVTVEKLTKLGFLEAFAVQTVLLPRLLSRIDDSYAPVNDLCVGAPTGSGKTLAYTLPIAIALRGVQHTPKLRAVIVVPTRELVTQVSTMMSALADKRVGVAVGHQIFADEQSGLVELGHEHDVARYEALMARVKRRQCFDLDGEEVEAENGDHDFSDEQLEQYLEDSLKVPPYSVPKYHSKVDILVCTPGRLVEHLNSTVGFTLDDVEWLIIDEADQLLDQSYQDWVAILNRALQKDKRTESMSDCVVTPLPRYVCKVILSATMTKDINHLNALRLRRPSMIVVQSTTKGLTPGTGIDVVDERKGEFELPATLAEFAVPIGDGAEKPLYLISLLENLIGNQLSNDGAQPSKINGERAGSSRHDSDSSMTSDSDSSSSGSSDSSSSDSSSDSSDDDSIPDKKDVILAKATPTAVTAMSDLQMLIFTSSTSEAHRLSHLLGSMMPEVERHVLTREHTSLRALQSSTSKARVIIATDLAGRGLDLSLSHVVNYTIPRSVESYVHRVGRTARAGRAGQAYSLVADKEAAWFWNAIARSTQVKRGQVIRQRIVIGKTWTEGAGRSKYEKILAEMSTMVDDEGHRGVKKTKLKTKS